MNNPNTHILWMKVRKILNQKQGEEGNEQFSFLGNY